MKHKLAGVTPKNVLTRRTLRERGLMPVRWAGTAAFLRGGGIAVEEHEPITVINPGLKAGAFRPRREP